MINLLLGTPVPNQQDIIKLITEQPPAIVQQVKEKELTVDEKIKSNFYKCNTDLQWIRADNAQCLPKVQNITENLSETVNNASVSQVSGHGNGSTGLNGYEDGSCTGWVASHRHVPPGWGNATSWKYNALRAGWTVSSTPVAGAIGWVYGHVVYVESVNGDGTVTISEANYDWVRYHTRTRLANTSEFTYLY